MSESDSDRASRYLRTLVAYAKRNAVYSLGLEIDGKHADIVCIRMNGGGHSDDVLVPVAKLINKADVDALLEKFGAIIESEVGTTPHGRA